MFSHKKLLIIDGICLIIIIWALAVRVSRSLPQTEFQSKTPSLFKPAPKTLSYQTGEPANKSSPVPEPIEAISENRQNSASEPVPVAVRPSTAITARSYLVGNVATGVIYLEHNGAVVLPVASMSKLVTAIVAMNTFSATTSVSVTPEETDVPQDDSGLSAGERFSASDLLYPLLLDSSNVAAEALASSSDRINFLNQMNAYSWEIGMPHTFFADPTGLSSHNQATAEDFFALAKYLYRFRPDILALTRTESATTATTTDHGGHVFVSIHPFVKDPRFIGGKTGHTPEAGDTMLTILRLDNQPIAFIVLGSQSKARAADTSLLIGEAEKTLRGKNPSAI